MQLNEVKSVIGRGLASIPLAKANPARTPEITFATPMAPTLTSAAAIAAPRTADETGLEQERANAKIKAGARNRM